MKKKNTYLYLTTTLLIIFDQVTKYLCLNINKKIIPKFFSLTYVQNKGALGGMFSGMTFLFIISSFIALYLIFKYRLKDKYFLGTILIISGIIGNLIDRIFRGYVIDFLDFKIFGYSYPVFNLADSFLVIGVFLILIKELKDETR